MRTKDGVSMEVVKYWLEGALNQRERERGRGGGAGGEGGELFSSQLQAENYLVFNIGQDFSISVFIYSINRTTSIGRASSNLRMLIMIFIITWLFRFV